MDWIEVIEGLENTVRGAERIAKLTSDPYSQLEAKIVSGMAAALAAALRNGLDATEYERKVAQMKKDFPNGI